MFDIERNRDLKTVGFEVRLPAEITDTSGALGTLELASVDGVPVPETIRAVSATANSATFEGWSIVRYCRDGVTELGFRGTAPDGQVVEGSYPITIKVQKKKQRSASEKSG